MPKLPDLPVIAVTPRLRRGNKQVLMTCARAARAGMPTPVLVVPSTYLCGVKSKLVASLP